MKKAFLLIAFNLVLVMSLQVRAAEDERGEENKRTARVNFEVPAKLTIDDENVEMITKALAANQSVIVMASEITVNSDIKFITGNLAMFTRDGQEMIKVNSDVNIGENPGQPIHLFLGVPAIKGLTVDGQFEKLIEEMAYVGFQKVHSGVWTGASFPECLTKDLYEPIPYE